MKKLLLPFVSFLLLLMACKKDNHMCSLSVGDTYQGGKIAYLDKTGKHGLIASPIGQGAGEWGCFGTEIAGADGVALGTGNQNTIDIIAGCETALIAARICDDLVLNGFSDWYLPSKEELNKLHLNQGAIGDFAADFYWSSSEFDLNSAWVQDFSNGGQYFHYKSDDGMFSQHRVRAVRAF